MVEFGYSLNGAQVRIGEEGWAARFVVEQGQITEFQLWFRSYTDSGTTSVVLPVRQALAAMETKGHEERSCFWSIWTAEARTGLRLLGGRTGP